MEDTNLAQEIEEYVSVPLDDVIKFDILNQRRTVLNELQICIERQIHGQDPPLRRLKAVTSALYIRLKGGLSRSSDPEHKKITLSIIIKSKYSELKEIIETMENFMDLKALTRFDTKRKYDSTNIVEINRMFSK